MVTSILADSLFGDEEVVYALQEGFEVVSRKSSNVMASSCGFRILLIIFTVLGRWEHIWFLLRMIGHDLRCDIPGRWFLVMVWS